MALSGIFILKLIGLFIGAWAIFLSLRAAYFAARGVHQNQSVWLAILFVALAVFLLMLMVATVITP